MSNHAGTFPVIVTAIEDVTPLIRVFTLTHPEQRPLPGFSGGSHVVALIPGPATTYRNAYSLMSSPFDTMSYKIGVRRSHHGRGGSAYLHDVVCVGATVYVTQPVNNFPLNRRSTKHVFLAAGVGITPIIAHIHDLRVGSIPYECHYVTRDADHAGMERFIGRDGIGETVVYHRRSGAEINFGRILRNQPLGADVYICGPVSMIDACIASARQCGWADSHVHSEIFVNASAGDAFEAILQRTQKRIAVPPEISLMEALESAGIDIPYLCRGGACGYCEIEVLEIDGEIIHRDIWLSDEDKATNRKMMPCVSRAKCRKLVLNL